MVNYSYEFLSLLVLFVILSSLLRRRRTGISLSRLFLQCIAVNTVLAFTDILAALTLNYAEAIPLWINMLVNTVYFALTYIVIAMYTIYGIHQVVRYAEDKQSHKMLIMVYLGVCIFCLLLLIYNLFTGVVFHFDEGRNYVRGPVWFTGYILLILSLFVVIFTSVRTHSVAGNPFSRLLTYLMPIVYVAILFKLMFPNANIESFIGAITGLLIFINFQTTSLEMDPLTKLRNLSSFNEMIRYKYERNENFQIILVSMRDFGSVNSTLGYSGGNEILYKIADWLGSFYYGFDLFRYGPVTFVVILPGDEASGAAVHKLIDSFPSSWNYDDVQYHITPYFVDYMREFDKEDPYRVVEALDFARKEMRGASINHVHFNEELAKKLDQRKKLIEYLRNSISTKRFEVYLQPIYSREDNGFTSAEALLRLKDEDGHFLSPEIFATVAEENMLDIQINHQIIETVCSFLGRYPNLPVRSISINLTMRQLQDLNFADELIDTMKKYSVPGDRIALEVTERIMLSTDTSVQFSLFKLRVAGFILLLDDFGTGYSNFSSLLRCRFDKIKLDKTLLMTKEKKDLDIIATLIKLFHSNGQLVVVEGAETEEQRDMLIRLGADFIQGYIFSRPLPMDDYVDFIMKARGTEYLSI